MASKIMVFDDTKLSGEATTQPHSRIPPYRATRLKKLIYAVLKTREDPPTELPDDFVFVWHDAFKRGLSI